MVFGPSTSRSRRKKTLDRRQTDWIKGQERVRPMGLVGAVGLRLEDGCCEVVNVEIVALQTGFWTPISSLCQISGSAFRP